MHAKQIEDTKRYCPEMIENNLNNVWKEEDLYNIPNHFISKQYVLSMFPYPSGDGLHAGHTRIYTGSDVLARYLRMTGCAVLHPMGWDAFGLPAENAAKKKGIAPQKLTEKNIANFKRQTQMLGLSYDWNRELATCDPKYFRWTQWLFLTLFKMGLLCKNETPVYFCDSCKTGLAEEEVLANGTHERCGNLITRKKLSQWVFRITKYAESLLKELDQLDWPSGIVEMQKNWIGRSKGVDVSFSTNSIGYKEPITVFTTRIDTLFGVTGIAVAPEHPFVDFLAKKGFLTEDACDYITRAKSKLDLERTDLNRNKTGVFTGQYAKHPLGGEDIPIWITDYVLGWYGRGAVMMVPAHDERDWEFAQKYKIAIKTVIEGREGANESVYTGEGTLINSGVYSNLNSRVARKKISEDLEKEKKGKRKSEYALRDWIFSRQRYWGEPIPMIYCSKCAHSKRTYWNSQLKDSSGRIDDGIHHNIAYMYQKKENIIHEIESELYGWFPVNEELLPLQLSDSSVHSKQNKESLAVCPVCGEQACRETDTMPNWAGSCWYFLAFAMPNILQKEKSDSAGMTDQWKKNVSLMKKWLPVDYYIGGAEHAVLHLLYTRFWMHALNDLSPSLFPVREPFKRLRTIGMVLAEDGRKMSKSFGNVVNPDEIVKEYGTDTLRVYVMFMAPFSSEVVWSTQAMQGPYRFLTRIWQIYNNTAYITDKENDADKILIAELQTVINKVSKEITDVKFNTAISTMMEFTNKWQKNTMKLERTHAKNFLKLLAPFAPFITDHLWRNVFNEKTSIHVNRWPMSDTTLRVAKDATIPVQVNGKIRDLLICRPDELDEKTVVRRALTSKKVMKWVDGKKFTVIYKEGRIISFVVKVG